MKKTPSQYGVFVFKLFFEFFESFFEWVEKCQKHDEV